MHMTPSNLFDNPSHCYILVLLAPFVVWGYMCNPFIIEVLTEHLKPIPGKHFDSKTVPVKALNLSVQGWLWRKPWKHFVSTDVQ